MSYMPCLEKIQIGQEAVIGTGVVTDIQLPGITNVRIDPKVEAMQLIDKRGTTMPSHEAFIKRRWSEGTIEGYLNYKEAPVWLNGMFGTDDSSPHAYLAQPAWAGAAEESLTLKYGQTGALFSVDGVMCKNLKLSGSAGEPVMFAYDFFGKPVADGATFAALADDTVTWVQGTDATFSMDAGSGATMGTTELELTGFSWEANITCDRQPVWHLGSQQHDSYKRGKWGGSLKLVLEGTDVMLAHLGNSLDALLTPISYAIEIEHETALHDIFTLQFVGTVIDAPTLITDSDDIVTVEMTLVPTYGSDLTTCWAAGVTIV